MTTKQPSAKQAQIIALRESDPLLTLTAIGNKVGVSRKYVSMTLIEHRPDLRPKKEVAP